MIEDGTFDSGQPTPSESQRTTDIPSALALTATSDPSAIPLAPSELRFVPGALVGGRFRIVAAAGHGGMGEVYKAEDLRLRQFVALKFLPQPHASDAERLDRLVREVRLARGVAHPNVCRVYDFVDTGSEQFVTMEYVDGESLAALLKRLGRLPPDRTLALAQQIVRGLAAVHELGILHRDLKPENVMVDGRGNARLMDFGIASLSGERSSSTVLLGTPCYVAPEQFYGAPPSSRTDVYALGVLLYELLTGRLPFGGRNLDELARRKSEEMPVPPSQLAEGIEAPLEQLVLRCLANDPAARFTSARAVAEALPGGDVLDVALAAGDTPDREVVADAADAGAIPRGTAWLVFAGVIAALAVFGLLLPMTSLTGEVASVATPDALAERCTTVLHAAGWQPGPGETNSGFGTEWSRYLAIAQADSSPGRWRQALRGFSPLHFYYRFAGTDAASTNTPRSAVSAMVDHTGRLISLEATPALKPTWAEGPGQDLWSPLFSFAGLDRAAFSEVPPRLTPPLDHDRRLAWEGPFPGDPALLIHVEAASLGGRVASFRVLRAGSVGDAAGSAYDQRMALGQRVEALLLLLPFLAGLWLALRYLRLGRVDRQGSLRLGVSFFAAGLAAELLAGSPLVRLEQGALTAPALGSVLVVAAFAWVLYMAAEPYVRRRWPRPLVGWARLLGGRFGDPIVGRDLLLGVMVGSGCCVLLAVLRLPLVSVLMPPLPPFMPDGDALASGPGFAAQILVRGMRSVAFGLAVLVALVVLRSLVRSELLAVTIALVAVIVPHAIYVAHQPLVFLAVHFAVFFASTMLIRRAGLLAFIVFYFTYRILVDLAGSADPLTWTGRQGLAALGLLALLAAVGLYNTLGRRLVPLRPLAGD